MRQRVLAPLAVVLALAACGRRADHAHVSSSPAAAPVAAKPAAAPAAAPGGSPTTAVPLATGLLSAIPSDTPFVLVARAPVPAALWTRLTSGLDPSALRAAASLGASGIAPIQTLEASALAELADAIASGAPGRHLGIAPTARFALYGAGLVPVFRLELADPAATRAAAERVLSRAGVPPLPGAAVPTWITGSGHDALLVAIAGNQLVLARGARAVLDRDAARLVAAAPAPLAEADLARAASDHGLAAATAAGWIDTARIAAIARAPGAAASLDELPPRCRDEALDQLAGLGRIAIGLDVPAPDRVQLAMALPLDPATAASLQAASAASPSLPEALPGHPIVAFALMSPPDQVRASWLARTAKLEAACAPGKPVASLPAPWSSIRGAALVVYSGQWTSLIPSDVDGFAALTAPDLGPILAKLAQLVPAFASLRDGGAFAPVPGGVPMVAPDLAVARRGAILIGATGAQGRAHAGDFAVHGAAPMARFAIDLSRVRSPDAAAEPASDDQFFVAGGRSLAIAGGSSSTVSGFALEVTATAQDLRATLDVTLVPPHAAAPSRDPRAARRDACRQILWHALAATRPAIAKLGITDDLEALQDTYTGSIEADEMIRACAKLDDSARACLLAAPDPIAAAAKCALAGDDDFDDSRLALPPLISFFGPDPLRARLHPPVDVAALRARLAGTWVQHNAFGTETWQLDAQGHLTVTEHPKDEPAKIKHYTLDARGAGELELHEGDGYETKAFFMPDAHTFYTGTDELAPITAEDHFVVPLGQGYLVREPAGCSVVTKQGLVVPAKCTVATERGARTLAVEYSPPCRDAQGNCAQTEHYRFFPGWIVAADAVDHEPFVKQR